jgi:hypothetical protein
VSAAWDCLECLIAKREQNIDVVCFKELIVFRMPQKELRSHTIT